MRPSGGVTDGVAENAGLDRDFGRRVRAVRAVEPDDRVEVDQASGLELCDLCVADADAVA
jgi:hypothetical protein